jgi:anti-sigma regulatory factor (Ser/Thr protein kinase)
MAEPCTISLHLPCAYRYLALVRDAALEFCQSVELGEFLSYQLEMAVDEACANVIETATGANAPTLTRISTPGFASIS